MSVERPDVAEPTRRRLTVAVVTKGGGAGLAFVGFVLLAMSTSTSTFGLVGSIFALASIGGVAGSLGLHVVVLRLWPELTQSKGAEAAVEQAGVAARLSVRYGCVGALLTGVVALGAFDSGIAVALPAGALALLLTIAEFLSGLLRAQDRDLLGLVPKDLVWRVGFVGAFGYAVLADIELTASAALWVLVGSLAVALVPQLPELGRELRTRQKNATADGRSMLTLAAPMWVGALLTACAQLLDVAVVGAVFDGETTALYVAATRVSTLVALPLIALNQQSGPMIADAYYSHGPPAVQQLFRRFMRFSVMSIIGLASIVAVAGTTMLGLFDVDVDRAVPVLAVLVVGHMVDALSGPSNMALQMVGRQKLAMVIAVVAQSAALSFVIAGAALDAIVLVAVSNVVLQIGRNVPAVVALRRREHIDPSFLASRGRVLV